MRTLGLLLVTFVGTGLAHATTETVDPETCFDLDNGVPAEDDFGFGCPEAGDITWAFNGGPPAFQPLFWNEQYTDVGYVPHP